ncbi:oxidoreductase [Kitasatospora herbaricolor]|uniref:NAD(P)-binding domain-containing protein n=1 Tax=Kitasatospora herbaricolor TaxID=68217 RepID=UPI001749EA46|nr:NAD(P)-binding domain-containing protein [Kitasatospora herbaricolor]MDQ0311623.1 cation diffusion facilitator CzcD-associated flavoprotein CzcO [Kitasatospora herbaricolor]GGU95584.1 oxidoreductase [Kitasatospora herbaricolor]
MGVNVYGATVVGGAGAATRTVDVDVVVIGAGQAGLSAAYHLRRRGFAPVTARPGDLPAGAGTGDGGGFVVLDADGAPGGAWAHRSPSLRMATVHGFHDLPDFELPPPDPDAPAREVVPGYFAAYEARHALPVVRPVRVHAVRTLPDSRLLVETDAGHWTARALINATGTWTRPFLPHYPGRFGGRQLHYADYRGPEEFAGRRVLVVGGGASAIQVLSEVAAIAETVWVTRTPPVYRDGPFSPEAGRAAVAMVEERVRQGLPVRSVVSVTGLGPSVAYRRARELGALDRRPMFDRLTEHGVAWGEEELAVDAIVWATGFRPEVGHLAPLGLRGPGGGIRMDGTRATDDPRIHLVGYGPSASTVGANRAGRAAVNGIVRLLGDPARRPAAAVPAQRS